SPEGSANTADSDEDSGGAARKIRSRRAPAARATARIQRPARTGRSWPLPRTIATAARPVRNHQETAAARPRHRKCQAAAAAHERRFAMAQLAADPALNGLRIDPAAVQPYQAVIAASQHAAAPRRIRGAAVETKLEGAPVGRQGGDEPGAGVERPGEKAFH